MRDTLKDRLIAYLGRWRSVGAVRNWVRKRYSTEWLLGCGRRILAKRLRYERPGRTKERSDEALIDLAVNNLTGSHLRHLRDRYAGVGTLKFEERDGVRGVQFFVNKRVLRLNRENSLSTRLRIFLGEWRSQGEVETFMQRTRPPEWFLASGQRMHNLKIRSGGRGRLVAGTLSAKRSAQLIANAIRHLTAVLLRNTKVRYADLGALEVEVRNGVRWYRFVPKSRQGEARLG